MIRNMTDVACLGLGGALDKTPAVDEARGGPFGFVLHEIEGALQNT
jgi:hypothetical protein